MINRVVPRVSKRVEQGGEPDESFLTRLTSMLRKND